jgi:hypothetical protein
LLKLRVRGQVIHCMEGTDLSTSWIKDKAEHEIEHEAELMQLRSFGD